jgi:hypothetical protein
MSNDFSLRPTCINHGCNRPVANSGARYRPVCSHCHCAGYGKHPYSKGVTPFRTGKCSNQSGHLGFKCPINYKKASWAIGRTEIDHIDGNHLNNTSKNGQELCPMCHRFKGMLTGDYKNQNGRYREASSKI